MRSRALVAAGLILAAQAFTLRAAESLPSEAELDQQFKGVVLPFVENYCQSCHSGDKPKAQFDLTTYANLDAVVNDYPHWKLVLEKLEAKEMPPAKEEQPSLEDRQQVVAWIAAVRKNQALKNAGDPGIVLARRLSNAEYNYSIRDLTGIDLRPTREFPVDPGNPAGFDNTGESLNMSPALMAKYLQAARDVADHVVFKPHGLAFAPYPMLVETDRDKYCVTQIIDFYKQQDIDYADYFTAAWRYKNRQALGKPDATLANLAKENKVSPKYLAAVWQYLEETPEEVGPGAKLQKMWKSLPTDTAQAQAARTGCETMRDFVVQLRKKTELRFTPPALARLSTSQPILMWRNRQYATHRRDYDRGALQVEGEKRPEVAVAPKPKKDALADEPEDEAVTVAKLQVGDDPDLFVPKGEREKYEAAFGRFCSIFPDAFYVSERGRNYLDKTKDKGRLLSAGFHNVMGYFRDDQALCELILDDAQKQELDEYWQELDFVAAGCARTYVQFYLNESGEARAPKKDEAAAAVPEDKAITSEQMIQRVAENYLNRVRGTKNEIAIKAAQEHFAYVNATIRWVEQAKLEAEPSHLAMLVDFAARAYRRPLTDQERDDLLAYYHELRDKQGLDHEAAIRDSIVSVLMMPDFLYRIDLVEPSGGVQPLSDLALASRLSYFLWSSVPDQELIDVAASGQLHKPEVIAAQARRMLHDPRVLGLVTEFGGNWLDFRRFEEINTVDRERFTTFDNDLREAMFQEPLHFLMDLVQNNRSVFNCVDADYTFVNPALAKHYGMPDVAGGPDTWVRVDHADQYHRGGLLPMAVFLTKNAPGLRTSPVKRGYWVVKYVLGEQIPPPPAAVPELPRDEKKLDLPLREMLAKHRENPSCAACHSRFDSMGLVFEGYGPVGDCREADQAGHPVDAHATFPGGSEGTGFDGLRTYIREHRQQDFVDSLCRKLLAYGLNRSLILSDDVTIEQMRTKASANGYRFDTLVEGVVTSPQFLTKRGRDALAQKGE